MIIHGIDAKCEREFFMPIENSGADEILLFHFPFANFPRSDENFNKKKTENLYVSCCANESATLHTDNNANKESELNFTGECLDDKMQKN